MRASSTGVALAAAAVASLSAPAALADTIYPAANPKGQYAQLNALPDWGGVWVLEIAAPPPPPQPKGEYLDRYTKAAKAAAAHNGEFARVGSSSCEPRGMPYQMALAQYPIEFLFNPGRVTILFEAWTQVRRIFTDGRPQEAADPTYFGFSTGRWDNGALVVETQGIKPAALMAPGVEHSDKEVITEKLHLLATDPDILVDDLTITDPDALTAPWTAHYRYHRHREWNLLEYACAENDRNQVDAGGYSKF